MPESNRQPHVVIVHWHDLGTHLGCYGAAGVPSPSVDALASEGVRFSRAFSTAPLCSPARGSLFTGQYPHVHGLMGLVHRGWEYRAQQRTLPQMLAPHGYHSVLVGLQHEAANAARLGFDEVLGGDLAHPLGRDVAELAVERLRERPERPTFFAIGFVETHRPFPAGAAPSADVPSWLPNAPETREDLGAFHAAIADADAATARILGAIEDGPFADDTLVIFTTDHGAPFPRAKGTLYDGGLHVALIMRPPRSWRTPPRVVDELVSHLDVAQTVLDLAGAGGEGPGHSLAPALRSEPIDGHERLFAEKTYHDRYDPIRSVRTATRKYIRNFEESPALLLPPDLEDSPTRAAMGDAHLRLRAQEELYDLDADPNERTNVAACPEYAHDVAELRRELDDWLERTNDPIREGRIAPPSSPSAARV